MKFISILFLLVILTITGITAQHEEKILRLEADLNAPVSKVWNAWTTEDGVQTFFAPACKIDLKVDGAYEIYFNPMGEEGTRGGEGNKILAIEPEKLFSFTWNAPPQYKDIRNQRTTVILRFEKVDDKHSKIYLTEVGWGDSPEWNKVYDYFLYAWDKVVLARLKYRFSRGPINWSDPPRL